MSHNLLGSQSAEAHAEGFQGSTLPSRQMEKMNWICENLNEYSLTNGTIARWRAEADSFFSARNGIRGGGNWLIANDLSIKRWTGFAVPADPVRNSNLKLNLWKNYSLQRYIFFIKQARLDEFNLFQTTVFLLQKAEMMFFAFFAIVILHLFPFPMRPLQ